MKSWELISRMLPVIPLPARADWPPGSVFGGRWEGEEGKGIKWGRGRSERGRGKDTRIGLKGGGGWRGHEDWSEENGRMER